MATNPSVQELKIDFIANNEKLIRKQKISILQQGSAFPKFPNDRKNKGMFFYCKLLKNRKTFTVTDWDKNLGKALSESGTYNISDIRHLVTGRACPHVKDKDNK